MRRSCLFSILTAVSLCFAGTPSLASPQVVPDLPVPRLVKFSGAVREDKGIAWARAHLPASKPGDSAKGPQAAALVPRQ